MNEPSGPDPWAPPERGAPPAAPAPESAPPDAQGSAVVDHREPPVAAGWAPDGYRDGTDEESPTPPVDTDGLPDLFGESIRLGPVEAAEARSPWAVRILMALGAALVVAVAAGLALGAGTADGGAGSPREALSDLTAAVSEEDYLRLAETVDPAERDSLFNGGRDLVEELIRLDGLDADIDLSAIGGLLVDADDVEVAREERLGDIALLYLEESEVAFVVDVEASALGSTILGALTDEQRKFFTAGDFTVGGDDPVVTVRRDDRWYVSVFYTFVHNVIAAASSETVDFSRTVPRIGAATPQDAVRGLADELMRLDLRRAFGSLDPDQVRVLNDYAWAVVDPASEQANATLARLDEDGWSWRLDTFELVVVDEDDATAIVAVEALDFVAESGPQRLSVSVADGEASVVFDGSDVWGETYRTAWVASDGCFELAIVDADLSFDDRVCGAGRYLGDLPAILASAVAEPGLEFTVNRVDGEWYVAPVSTALALITGTLGSWTADDLSGAVGLAFGADAFEQSVVSRVPDEVVVGGNELRTEVSNLDLLPADISPLFAYDLDAQSLAYELGIFAPTIEAPVLRRGLYASAAAGSGDVAILVLETDAASATAVAAAVQASPVDTYGVGVVAEAVGDTVVIVGNYDATESEQLDVLERMMAGASDD